MNAWFNEKGNWCFEFDPKEHETERFILLISEGTHYWRKRRRKYREAFISASLFNECLGVIFVGQNYTQEHPTIDKPMVVTSEKEAEHAVKMSETPLPTPPDGIKKKGWNAAGFNRKDLALIKKKLKDGTFKELL